MSIEYILCGKRWAYEHMSLRVANISLRPVYSHFKPGVRLCLST